ncbi:DNA-binding winged helix-turn-helix (wHTH) protein [Raoultella sp. BIGb0138]|uniref:winged helix-turn-helix domain-containing protein n=1 Tax=Raoultella sp. BIGb0138 TaxID=2485115 RepID=UPI001051D898|nr:winged helix-turn-helix domain-containing protein [Raoultella sp. BIGb0138]TCW13676.1 DNA-binding winged helix-turn-helix (wHTH) protein [Raoultella sp. BIGb0138]
MHKYYIINEKVEFHPATSTLHDLNHPDRVVVLNSPAGRCLLLLIERAGTIVTQQECMDIVWQRRGMLVSSNTYYQNISILRKGLKKIGLDNDPVVTIPRIGLTLASGTQITIKEAYPRLSESEENAKGQQSDTAEPIAQPVPETANSDTSVKAFSSSALRQLWLAGALLALLLLAGIGVINHSFAQGNHFVDDYRFLKRVGECRVYLASGIQMKSEQTMALSYIEYFKDDCGNFPWIYIASYALPPRASVIRCDRSMKEPNRCISDYFIEDR